MTAPLQRENLSCVQARYIIPNAMHTLTQVQVPFYSFTKGKGSSSHITPPTKEDELTKQLKYQQHQIDALVGQVKY